MNKSKQSQNVKLTFLGIVTYLCNVIKHSENRILTFYYLFLLFYIDERPILTLIVYYGDKRGKQYTAIVNYEKKSPIDKEIYCRVIKIAKERVPITLSI